MGDEITIESIQIIQGGLVQIDFKNEQTKKIDRCFVDPYRLFKMIGAAMQKNVDKWAIDFERKRIANLSGAPTL